MRRSIAALAAALVMLASPGVAAANPVFAPPYVERAEWAKWGEESSLRVYPTQAGRAAAGQVHNPAGGQAWTEVLALAPDADIPGMREQFICHWSYAEFAQPGKISWNLEPWRPTVDEETMISTGCNPGGTEEPF